MSDITITLDEDDWMKVVSGLVRATQIQGLMYDSERQMYREAGKKVAEACPKGSGPWFGAALLGGDE